MIVIGEKTSWDFNGRGEILLVDKPLGWTSLDVVKKVRSLFHISRAGHTGTLDPRATGLLIVCTGAQTKNIDSFMQLEKEYTGSFELGIRTPSFDLETDIVERKAVKVSADQIVEAMTTFVGKQLQVPPMYSAAKYAGKPLYTYARRGKTVTRTAKEIEIKSFSATRIQMPVVDFRVVSSKGAYIRSLIDDLGQRLGCGACLVALRRTRIGDYSIESAATVDELTRLAISSTVEQNRKHEVGVSA